MLISTEINSAATFVGEERAVELVAKAGFDAWDFSMFANMCAYNRDKNLFSETDHPLSKPNYLEFARNLRRIGEDNGIFCNQSHAPFPFYTPTIEPYLKRAIECTAEAGGKICVIHPHNYYSAEENKELYLPLLEFAKGCGVKIATENMWGTWNEEENHATFAACANEKDFTAHLETIDDEDFVACLDIGHAEMMGLDTSAVSLIEALGEKLQSIHLHDNDLRYDLHDIPFSRNIDFDAVVKALKKINYKGEFTLECGPFLKNNYNKDNLLSGLVEMRKSARRLADMFEEY